MDEYVKKIIEVCTEAEPAQKMTFDNFASYVLCVEKDETNKVNISIYEKNAIKREGRYKDLLIDNKVGIHVSDLYNVLTAIINEEGKL